MGFGALPVYAFVTEISFDNKSLIAFTFFGSPTTNCNGGSACIGAYGSTSANAIAVDNTDAVVIGGNNGNQAPCNARDNGSAVSMPGKQRGDSQWVGFCGEICPRG
jgi:hypothetical protein